MHTTMRAVSEPSNRSTGEGRLLGRHEAFRCAERFRHGGHDNTACSPKGRGTARRFAAWRATSGARGVGEGSLIASA